MNIPTSLFKLKLNVEGRKNIIILDRCMEENHGMSETKNGPAHIRLGAV